MTDSNPVRFINSMKLKIEITMDNAAFDDGNNGRSEAARILGVVAKKLEVGVEHFGLLLDGNGNCVGKFEITVGKFEIAQRKAKGTR